jgi:hypothetical protein
MGSVREGSGKDGAMRGYGTTGETDVKFRTKECYHYVFVIQKDVHIFRSLHTMFRTIGSSGACLRGLPARSSHGRIEEM